MVAFCGLPATAAATGRFIRNRFHNQLRMAASAAFSL
jgi:hypothetical protein